jgi:hypothetical protein
MSCTLSCISANLCCNLKCLLRKSICRGSRLRLGLMAACARSMVLKPTKVHVAEQRTVTAVRHLTIKPRCSSCTRSLRREPAQRTWLQGEGQSASRLRRRAAMQGRSRHSHLAAYAVGSATRSSTAVRRLYVGLCDTAANVCPRRCATPFHVPQWFRC